MSELSEQIKRARAKWKFRGDIRPDFASVPGAGQESVWDYPRPPKIDPDNRTVIVNYKTVIVAESRNTVRILETSSPPVFYIPEKDIDLTKLEKGEGSSLCEWKGQGGYWNVTIDGNKIINAGWSYEKPFPGYEFIRNYVAFCPERLECFVDGERVLPQPGKFYGGWVTSEITGPFKGEKGSEWW